MNFAEQMVVVPSLILDASRNFSSPLYNSVSSFVGQFYSEQEKACDQVFHAFDELTC
ncbi:hypothetical protein PRIPAC_84583 [Pristionchus pacificus]|uniref:Uncharacterized protein n=1 Tax=Pristionchus pacificus TaxID=54126 RepID=A0A454XLL8_PRIPA|nr:hypothetical protein PRIPAC_84583 [Pristionchus pacificus]|eukprot:PDM66969.1 hypothetical protein PRIPAC_48386 [Pristionchus pacificus]